MHESRPLRIEVAGITFDIELPAAEWRDAAADRYAAFLSTAGPAWRVTVTHDPSLDISRTPWIRHDGPLTAFRLSDHAGRLDLGARRAAISAPTAGRVGAALDRLLAYICMQAAPREQDGLLLHAAGVVLGGAGHVFAGASGAGKTTIARLAEGHGQVLSDENVIVRLTPGGGPELCSTPFWGHSTPPDLIRRVNRRVPLAAIHILEHAAQFALARLAPAQAVMALLTTEKVATERPDSAAAWLATAERLIGQTPVYRLGFRPTAEVWDFLAATRVD